MTKARSDREAVPSRGREGADERERTEATVIELLPNATCRVELAGRGRLIAHAAGARSANFVRVRVKDKVLVELSPHDNTRGRIVKLLGKG
jgi:translation initiation factor IF-1